MDEEELRRYIEQLEQHSREVHTNTVFILDCLYKALKAIEDKMGSPPP